MMALVILRARYTCPDAVKDLIDRFVVVGVPDRYMQERWAAE
jgi:hypothetical protein